MEKRQVAMENNPKEKGKKTSAGEERREEKWEGSREGVWVRWWGPRRVDEEKRRVNTRV